MLSKDDEELHAQIIKELAWDPSVGHEEIAVAVRDGVVTLSGSVESLAERSAAVRAVERIQGVRAIANDLVVRLPALSERTDTDIAHAAANAIAWNSKIPANQVKARVEDGWVYLEGSVDWHFQRVAAEKSVKNLWGVKGVTNLITVSDGVSASRVKGKIEDAIKRFAEEDARRITVEVAGDGVILRGQVRTWIERQQAENAAWNAGVSRVDNKIEVNPVLSPAL
ncbi:MAG TPA: BON domain-containing protein [Planctomycetota bacterium]|nr:BON domain-containing protein [Planctomycetota bacterium]